MFEFALQVLEAGSKKPANSIIITLPTGDMVIIGTCESNEQAHAIVNGISVSST